MAESNSIGRVTVARRLDREHSVMCAEGSFGGFLQGFGDHTERWEVPLDGLTWTMLRQGLAALALHLAFRSRDESIGMTLNFVKPPVNVFLSGDAGDATLTGRAFTEGVLTAGSSRLFVQTHHARLGNVESMIEVTGLDVLDVFEQYYARSIQIPTRFFELEDDRFVMIQGLPNADRAFFDRLDREGVAAWLGDGLEPLDEREFRFFCGCNQARILETVRAIFSREPEDLFLGESGVEALCPRCGTRWWITREQFDGAAPEEDASPEPPPAGS